MNLTRLAETLEEDEGFRAKPYKDTLGVWTIGLGATNILGVPVTSKTPPVTYEQAKHLLYSHIFQAMIDALRFFPDLFIINDSRRAEVVVMAAFQLGYGKLSKFVRFRAGLMARDWELAARSLEESRWAQQTPKRVKRHTDVLRGKV